MILRDLHVHTTYCDGNNSPEEMVRAALDLKMKTIGFSVHGYTAFDESYCIPKNKIAKYRAEIGELKKKYNGRIEILCGVEQDYHAGLPIESFDYVIGSVHYIKYQDRYFPIDENEKEFKTLGETVFNGNYIALSKEYFSCVKNVAKVTRADIIGHFDLISKFNDNSRIFDEGSSEYIKYGIAAIDELVKWNKPFEINTGAVSRGFRKSFYPNETFLKAIADRGGRVILSSDSHSADNLCFAFEEAERYARSVGLEVDRI